MAKTIIVKDKGKNIIAGKKLLKFFKDNGVRITTVAEKCGMKYTTFVAKLKNYNGASFTDLELEKVREIIKTITLNI